MVKNSKDKPVYDNNGNIAVNNLNTKLMEQVLNKMKKTDAGICVGRQFGYGTEYPMLLINAYSETEGPESHVEVALWTNKDDADFYVTRSFMFKRTVTGIRKWEDFCEAVSDGSAIFEKDLIGNFFIGHITKTKTHYDNQVYYFENLVVDKFLGRIDPLQVDLMLPKESNVSKRKRTSTVTLLLEDEEE